MVMRIFDRTDTASFPAVSKSEKKIVKTIVNENFNHTTILGIARPKKEDIDVCIDSDLKEIVIFMPISSISFSLTKPFTRTVTQKNY